MIPLAFFVAGKKNNIISLVLTNKNCISQFFPEDLMQTKPPTLSARQKLFKFVHRQGSLTLRNHSREHRRSRFTECDIKLVEFSEG